MKFLPTWPALVLWMLCAGWAVAQEGAPRATSPGRDGCRSVTLRSHTPSDYANIIAGDLGPEATLGACYYRPRRGRTPHPAVIIVPGSGGVGSHQRVQAAMLAGAGFGVLLVDPFTGRGIHETGSDQGRLPFAASAYDVFAAVQYLRSRNEVDARRIGALGASRGGTGVIMAGSRQLSDTVLGPGTGLSAIVGGYPWCGVQFRSGELAEGARLLVLHGDRDDWVSVQQCQEFVRAARLSGARADMHIFPQAYHAFDREDVPLRTLDVARALLLPTIYLDDDGAYIDWRTGERNAALRAEDFVRYSVEGGFIERGVHVGVTAPEQAQSYRAEVLAFFAEALAPN